MSGKLHEVVEARLLQFDQQIDVARASLLPRGVRAEYAYPLDLIFLQVILVLSQESEDSSRRRGLCCFHLRRVSHSFQFVSLA